MRHLGSIHLIYHFSIRAIHQGAQIKIANVGSVSTRPIIPTIASNCNSISCVFKGGFLALSGLSAHIVYLAGLLLGLTVHLQVLDIWPFLHLA